MMKVGREHLPVHMLTMTWSASLPVEAIAIGSFAQCTLRIRPPTMQQHRSALLCLGLATTRSLYLMQNHRVSDSSRELVLHSLLLVLRTHKYFRGMQLRNFMAILSLIVIRL